MDVGHETTLLTATAPREFRHFDGEKEPCLYPLEDGRRCCECATCHRASQGGIPQHGIDRDFPLLYEMAQQYDFAERLGGSSSALLAEVDKALRELWNARAYMAEEAGRVRST